MIAWYVVHTHPNAEMKAVAHLERQGYEIYLPRYRKWRRHARRRELVWRPLFPRYLFIALDLLQTRWRPILSTVGVSRLVRGGDKPVPVASGLVEEIQEQERCHLFDENAQVAHLRIGDLVRVINGPFADQIGKFCTVGDHERISILLELLGREVKTSLSAEAIAAA